MEVGRMRAMSKIIYELTAKSIQYGYQNNDEHVIEKETDFIMGKIVTLLLSYFNDKIKGITFDKNMWVDWDIPALKWLKKLVEMKLPATDLEFGKLKVDLENWYYQIGGEKINFEYHESYLLTPKEASEQLGISKVTLNKYIQMGLESINTTSHKKIPKYVIELWKDPVYAIRMQMIAQEKKLREQSPADRLAEINNELTQLHIKYKTDSYEKAFNDFDGDSMDDPTDYYLWRDLENEKKEIIRLLGGG